jgi:hypothetical protein
MPSKPSADRIGLGRIALALALIAAVGAVAVQVSRTSAGRLDDPCTDGAAGSATLLMDFRKPMRNASAAAVVREIAGRLDAGVELDRM